MTLTDEQRAKVEELVAEKVMGWTWFAFPDLARCMLLPMPKDEPRWEPDSGWRVKSWPHGFAADTSECNFTTSGDAMLEVIEKMEKRCPRLVRTPICSTCTMDASDDPHDVLDYVDESRSFAPVRRTVQASALSMPLAVAKCALSAVGVDWRAELGVEEDAE
jgi:hypothetical protein